jgi:hypothetical protein
MNKLFVRLAVAGAVTVGVVAPAAALADSASIDLTGPFSTNVVTSSNRNSFNQLTSNRLALGNWNNQYARSGNVSVWGNTKVFGDGMGSGNAYNINSGRNNVDIYNGGSAMPPWNGWNGNRSGNGSIFLTGPGSFNRISDNNSNRFNDTTVNNVRANNFSNQTARSGNVRITGNTLVYGVGGSGDATNVNSGVNTVNIDNNGSAVPGWGSWSGNNGGGNAAIAVTGPGSFNAISGRNSSSVNLRTINNVQATNSNHQNATTGNVTISGNTVVSGVGGSGDATNWNSGENNVGIGNN